eukprot:PhM_4_TR14664/c0_g1_i1/m.35503
MCKWVVAVEARDEHFITARVLRHELEVGSDVELELEAAQPQHHVAVVPQQTMRVLIVLQLSEGFQVRRWQSCDHLRVRDKLGVVRGRDIEVSTEKLLCIVVGHEDKTLRATVVQGSAGTELFAWKLAELYAVAALQLAGAFKEESGQHGLKFELPCLGVCEDTPPVHLGWGLDRHEDAVFAELEHHLRVCRPRREQGLSEAPTRLEPRGPTCDWEHVEVAVCTKKLYKCLRLAVLRREATELLPVFEEVPRREVDLKYIAVRQCVQYENVLRGATGLQLLAPRRRLFQRRVALSFVHAGNGTQSADHCGGGGHQHVGDAWEGPEHGGICNLLHVLPVCEQTRQPVGCCCHGGAHCGRHRSVDAEEAVELNELGAVLHMRNVVKDTQRRDALEANHRVVKEDDLVIARLFLKSDNSLFGDVQESQMSLRICLVEFCLFIR